MLFFCFFFFLQAEVGIRDAQESRGLGDVYKRQETDRWFESYLDGLDASALEENLAFRFTDGDAGRMTREEMLFHVLTHGAYHRGNVGQVLKGIAITPPRDLLTKFLHQREPARRQNAAS